MPDIEYQPSAFAPIRVVRHIMQLAPRAVMAVEGHLGEEMPPLTIVIAGHMGLATADVMACGRRGAPKGSLVGYWMKSYRNSRLRLGYTSATRSGRTLVGINARNLLRFPRAATWRTLTHELTHAIQLARPGQWAHDLERMDYQARIKCAPQGKLDAAQVLLSLCEAEAEAVENALAPDHEQCEPFDVNALGDMMHAAVQHWQNAAVSYGDSTGAKREARTLRDDSRR